MRRTRTGGRDVANITREERRGAPPSSRTRGTTLLSTFTGKGDGFRSRTASVRRRARGGDLRRRGRDGGDCGDAQRHAALPAADDDRVALPTLEAVNELVIEAEHAYSTAGVGIHRFVDPENDETFLYSQFATMYACHAFACFDQPDIKGTFEFTCTAPCPLGGGVQHRAPQRRKAQRPTARAPGHSTARCRLPTYATAVCAGPYAFVEGTITLGQGRHPRPRVRPAAARRALRRRSRSSPTSRRASSSTSGSSTPSSRTTLTTTCTCRSSTLARWRTWAA